jgi:hypothetical protein
MSTLPGNKDEKGSRLTIDIATPDEDKACFSLSQATYRKVVEWCRHSLPWMVAAIVGTTISIRPWIKTDQVCYSPKVDIADRK